MKKLFLIITVFLWVAGLAVAEDYQFSHTSANADALLQVMDSDLDGDTSDEDVSFNSVVIGDALDTAEVAYTVWEIKDSNDDVVASCVIYCNVITDGSQDCEIRYSLMADIDGTLTLERTDAD